MSGPDIAPRSDIDWIALYLDAAAAEQGAARNTLLAYGRDLKDAMVQLAGRGAKSRCCF